MLGKGSSKTPEIVSAFEVTEQICQGAFLVFFMLEMHGLEGGNKALKIIDVLSIISSFIGLHTQPHELSRYFLAFRVLKMIFVIKEIPALEVEGSKLIDSLKTASNLLLPIVLLILIYSIVGVHCFGGSRRLI